MRIYRQQVMFLMILLVCGGFVCNCSSENGNVPKAAIRAEVRLLAGRPQLVINGKPTPPVVYFHPDVNVADVELFAKAGVHVYSFDMRIVLRSWEEIEARIDRLIQADPQAVFFPRVVLNPYKEWLDKNPQCRTQQIDGATHGTKDPSFAAKSWADFAEMRLRQFIRGLERRYPGRVVGYHIAAGLCGEWFWPGCMACIDFNPEAVDAYQQYLKKRYKGNLATLNKAWGRTGESKVIRELTVADMETTDKKIRTAGKSAGPIFSEEAFRQGKRSLVLSHKIDKKRGGGATVFHSAAKPLDLTQYDRIEFWIRPETKNDNYAASLKMTTKSAKGFKGYGIGNITPNLAPKGKWTHVSFGVKRLPRGQVVRAFEFTLWNGSRVNKDGSEIKFYIDDVKYVSRAPGKIKSFTDIRPPDIDSRDMGDFGDFMNPSTRQELVDYRDFVGDVTVEKINRFARAVKEECKQPRIVGTFYNYFIGLSSRPAKMLHGVGHLSMTKLMRSPYVDFMCSPVSYYDRGSGGTEYTQCLEDSVPLHGKMWFNEVDSRTYLTVKERKTDPSLIVTPKAKSIEVLKRHLAHAFLKGAGMWWMDLTKEGWYQDADLMKVVSRGQEIYQEGLLDKWKSTTEIAVIVDDQSAKYLAGDSKVQQALVFWQVPEIARIGAPFDIYIAEDIGDDLPHHKLYIFLNLFKTNKVQMQTIHRILRRDKATALWLYAAGLLGKDISPDNMLKLTGIRFAALAEEYNPHMKIVRSDHPLGKMLPVGLEAGTNIRKPTSRQKRSWLEKTPAVSPVVYPVDDKAAVLARLNYKNKPGMVVKDLGEWKSVWSGAFPLPAKILREIAKYAGVHIYDDKDDFVMANSRFLAIHCRDDGQRNIALPAEFDVYDLWNKKYLARKARNVNVKAKKGSSFLFKLERSRK